MNRAPAASAGERSGERGSIRRTLEVDEVRAGLAALSVEIETISLGDFARLIKLELERWGSVVRAAGFTPQD
jgi:hypothetical protein